MSGRTLSPRVISEYRPANVSVATHLNISTSLRCGRVFVVAVWSASSCGQSAPRSGLEKLIRSICTSQWMYTFKVADYVFKLLLICFRATKLCARHVNYKSFAERGTWTELACQIRRLLQFTLTPPSVLSCCLANGLLSMCTSRKYELVMGVCLCGRRTLPQTAAATEKPHKISNSNNEPTRANTTTTVES